MKPPATAWSSVTVKVISSPSLALASSTVTLALSLSWIVPMAVSVAVTPDIEAVRPTVKISSFSTSASWVV